MKSSYEDRAKYVIESTAALIAEVGGRSPGSRQEAKAAELIRTAMKESGFQSVTVEPFQINPLSFYGYMTPSSVLGLLALWVSALSDFGYLAWLLGVSAAIPPVVISILYRRELDWLFPARRSQNVVGVIDPPKMTPVKRVLIVGGHIDSAWQWRYNTILRGALVVPIIAAAVASFVWGSVVLCPFLFHAPHWLRVCAAVALSPGLMAFAFFNDFSVVVPGANDNMASVFASIAIGRMAVSGDLQLGSTRVVVLATGSEEVGLRGAMSYVSRHSKELHAIETAFVALETLREQEELAVIDREVFGTSASDRRVVRMLHDAAARSGVKTKKLPMIPGSTDAGAFDVAGVPAACLVAMSTSFAPYYHTTLDHAGNMSCEAIAAAIEIVAEFAKEFDEKGLH